MTLPSVKNFQLQIEGAPDPNQVSLQFGKTGDNTFTVRPPPANARKASADKRALLLQMDYSFPLTPLQAFQVRHAPFCPRTARTTNAYLTLPPDCVVVVRPQVGV